jgi:hypothetical protein
MVRILRIISQLFIAGTCAAAIFVLVFGFRSQLEIQPILSQTAIIDELKDHFAEPTKKDDKESPLVVQARLFALRIDPPIPPKKITPQPPNGDQKTQPPVTDSFERELPKPPAEFTLIGTARYAGHPEKSLALLNLVSGGCKWVRQGEKVDQSIVGEIEDGKIVLCKDGTTYKNLFVPAPQTSSKSLLRN